MKKDSIKNGNNSTTEDTYRLLFDANRDSITIFKIDSQGIPSNFIEANPATSELLGYTKKELLSLSITDLENTTEEVRNQRLQTFKSEGKLDFETIIKNKNGEELYVETKTILINYLNEPAIMNITRDITEKKILEYTLKNTNENLRCILEAIPDLLFEVGIDGHIYHYQAHREDLLAAEPSMFLGKRMQDIIPEPAASICLEALIEANENGWSTGKEYALDLPKGKCWFEISVSPIIKSDPNNKRFIMLARDTSYRKFAEKERIENKENLQSIFDTVSEAIYVLDELGTFIDVNKGAEKMYLYSKKELIGKTPLDVAAPGLNNFDEVNKSIQAVFDNGMPVFLEFWAVRKNGEIFPKEVVLNKGKYSGKTVLIITARDISLQKEKEKTLLKTQEKLSSIFNLANSGIVLGDIEGNLLEFNDWWLEMLGYTAEEYAKLKMFGVTHPDDLEVSQQWLKRIVSGEIEKYKIEKRYIRKDGSVFWGESSVSVIKDKNNNITSTVGIVTDISERKITEESLRESEEKYRNLVENSPDGIFIFIDNKFAYANDEGLRIIKATSKQEIIGQTILQFIHPDNKQSAINSLKTILQSVVTSNLMEDKFITLDGDTIYVELKAIPIVFEKQNALQVIVHDITERKRTQDKIKQLSRAVEQSPVSIAITNTIGVLEYVNPKFMETTGYSLEELIGNKTNLLKSGHTSKKQYKNLWATITSGHEWYGEFRNKRKDGTLFWESASISPITNSHGITTHYIAIKEDITERKQIEQDLIKAKEKAEESDRLKLVFLANMSHEIRTPMNGILGFTELLKSPDLSKMKQQKFIKIIEESGHRMLNIINDIINISKIES